MVNRQGNLMKNCRTTWILGGLIVLGSLSIATAAEDPPAAAPASPAAADKPAAAEAEPGKSPAPPVPQGDAEQLPAAAQLSLEQEQIAERYRRFEELLLRMAELTAAEDPDRAALLRQTVARSKERLVGMQFERIIELLGADRLSNAVTQQGDVMQDLKSLLDLLLSEDRAKQLKTDQERIRGYLKEVNKLIKEQQGVQAQTDRGGQLDRLAGRQGQLADRAGNLGQQMRQDEAEARGEPGGEKADQPTGDNSAGDQSPDGEPPAGKPGQSDAPDAKSGQGQPNDGKSDGRRPDEKSDQQGDPNRDDGKSPGKEPSGDPAPGQGSQQGKGQPGQPQPGQPGQGGEPGGEPADSQPGQQPPPPEDDAQQRVAAAQQRMRDAQEKLEKALREDAVDKQEEALRELEAAKAELEKILRQMREEEMARILALLEARFRKMLEMQVEVYEGTIRLDRVPAESRGRGSEIESGRLSQTEAQIAIEADKALMLLKEEGSAVAMPEALEQTRDDMEQVTRKLADFDVGAITQGIEEDIIAGLEEMIAALQKAQEELEAQEGQPPPPGEPQEPPLVDQLAELRMIRSLQMRVNRRTQSYSKLIDGEQADKPELLEALEELARRQNRIYRTTRDIVVGKNR